MTTQQDVIELAQRAREASLGLGLATRAQKDAALLAMAEALLERAEPVRYAGGHRRPAPADSRAARGDGAGAA